MADFYKLYQNFREKVATSGVECTRHNIENSTMPWAAEYQEFWVAAQPYCQTIVRAKKKGISATLLAANDALLDEAVDIAIAQILIKPNVDHRINALLSTALNSRIMDAARKMGQGTEKNPVSEHKSRGANTLPLDEIDQERFSTVDAPNFGREEREGIQKECGKLLDQLSSKELLLLREMIEFPEVSTQEHADHLGLNPNTFKTKLRRMRLHFETLPFHELMDQWVNAGGLVSDLITSDMLNERLRKQQDDAPADAPASDTPDATVSTGKKPKAIKPSAAAAASPVYRP